MRKEQSSSFLTIGGASLLVTFLILALVIFSVLSLSTAKRELTLSEKQAGRTTDYYEADLAGELMIARIYEVLDSYTETQEARLKDQLLSALTADYPDISISSDADSDDLLISHEIPCGDTQILSVSIRISKQTGGEFLATVTEWTTHARENWHPDTTYDLIKIE